MSDNSPSSDLHNNASSIPRTGQKRQHGLRLLYWIMWNPYALSEYAINYTKAQDPPAQLDDQGQVKSPIWTVVISRFVSDIWVLTFTTWFTVACVLALVGVYWFPVAAVARTLLIGLLLGSVTGSVTFVAISCFLDDYAIGATWGFLAWIGLSTLYCFEIAYRFAPAALAGWHYLSFCIVGGILFGISANSILHGMVRKGSLTAHIALVRNRLLFTIALVLTVSGILATGVFNSFWIFYPVTIFTVCVGAAAGALSALLGYLRPVDWLWGARKSPYPPTDGNWVFPRVTPKPPLEARSILNQWFKKNWSDHLLDIECLWQNTNLRDDLRIRMQEYLGNRRDTDEIFQAVAQLIDNRFNWRLMDIFPRIVLKESAPLGQCDEVSSSPEPEEAGEPGYLNYRHEAPYKSTEPPRNLRRSGFTADADRIAAGFILLEQQRFDEAADCFAGLDNSASATELASMLRIIKHLANAKEILIREAFPKLVTPQDFRVRRRTWNALKQMEEALFNLWLQRRCRGPSTFAYASEQVSVHLKQVERADLRGPEGRILNMLAEWWEDTLNGIDAPPKEYFPLSQVANPFQIWQIQSGHSSYIVRSKLLDILQSRVLAPDDPRVLVYGLPGVGLTTLIDELHSRVPRISLRDHLVDAEDVQYHLFRLLADKIVQQFNLELSYNEYPNNSFEQAFSDFLFVAVPLCGGQLTIAVDDLEHALTMRRGEAPLFDALKQILYLSTTVDGLSVIWAGHLTRAEVVSICGQYPDLSGEKVALFNISETEDLLRNSIPKYTLALHSDVIQRTQKNTGGHPYLVCLTCDLLMQKFNSDLQRGGHHDPVFTPEDVDAIMRSGEFVRRAEARLYQAFLETAQRIDPLVDVLLVEIGYRPGVYTNEDLIHIVERQYGAQPERIRRILVELEALGLVMQVRSNTGQFFWRHTILLFGTHLSDKWGRR